MVVYYLATITYFMRLGLRGTTNTSLSPCVSPTLDVSCKPEARLISHIHTGVSEVVLHLLLNERQKNIGFQNIPLRKHCSLLYFKEYILTLSPKAAKTSEYPGPEMRSLRCQSQFCWMKNPENCCLWAKWFFAKGLLNINQKHCVKQTFSHISGWQPKLHYVHHPILHVYSLMYPLYQEDVKITHWTWPGNMGRAWMSIVLVLIWTATTCI